MTEATGNRASSRRRSPTTSDPPSSDGAVAVHVPRSRAAAPPPVPPGDGAAGGVPATDRRERRSLAQEAAGHRHQPASSPGRGRRRASCWPPAPSRRVPAGEHPHCAAEHPHRPPSLPRSAPRCTRGRRSAPHPVSIPQPTTGRSMGTDRCDLRPGRPSIPPARHRPRCVVRADSRRVEGSPTPTDGGSHVHRHRHPARHPHHPAPDLPPVTAVAAVERPPTGTRQEG